MRRPAADAERQKRGLCQLQACLPALRVTAATRWSERPGRSERTRLCRCSAIVGCKPLLACPHQHCCLCELGKLPRQVTPKVSPAQRKAPPKSSPGKCSQARARSHMCTPFLFSTPRQKNCRDNCAVTGDGVHFAVSLFLPWGGNLRLVPSRPSALRHFTVDYSEFPELGPLFVVWCDRSFFWGCFSGE